MRSSGGGKAKRPQVVARRAKSLVQLEVVKPLKMLSRSLSQGYMREPEALKTFHKDPEGESSLCMATVLANGSR